MLVTVIADASFYDDPRVAAWAFWIRSERGKFQFSGIFHKHIESSGHAELAAVANALTLGLRHPVCAGAKHILVQTDCQMAIDIINGKKVDRHHDIVEHLQQLMTRYGVSIQTRHIKGHVGRDSPRNYCQDWCDRTARALARPVWDKKVNHQQRTGGKHLPHERRSAGKYRGRNRWQK